MYQNAGIVLLAIVLGLVYTVIGVIFMCCVEKDRPSEQKVDIPESVEVMLWPLGIVFMLVVGIIGTISKWYYWVQK
jgi:hypothetical protein